MTTTIQDQTPDVPHTAKAMRQIALAGFLRVGSSQLESSNETPHLFSLGEWHYAVAEHLLSPTPTGLKLLGEHMGFHIYAIE